MKRRIFSGTSKAVTCESRSNAADNDPTPARFREILNAVPNLNATVNAESGGR
jgi:hypothetical protein